MIKERSLIYFLNPTNLNEIGFFVIIPPQIPEILFFPKTSALLNIYLDSLGNQSLVNFPLLYFPIIFTLPIPSKNLIFNPVAAFPVPVNLPNATNRPE